MGTLERRLKLLQGAKLVHRLAKERLTEGKALLKLGDLAGAKLLYDEADLLFDVNACTLAELDKLGGGNEG